MADGTQARVCVVTGATRGLGRATALGLAREGARVVITARDPEAGARTRDELARESGNANIDVLPLDLASLDSVRRAAAELRRDHRALHVLVNNAGINPARRAESADGYEMTFAVNHLGPFLLTGLLLPLLRAGAPSRIITVTSRFERMGRLRLDDIHLALRWIPLAAYTRSKLANVLFTYELAARLEGSGVTANCIHPGLVATDLMRDLPRWIRALYEPFLATPERAARAIVRLATAPELERVTGRYFERSREARSSPSSYDSELRRRLWQLSEELTSDDRAR